MLGGFTPTIAPTPLTGATPIGNATPAAQPATSAAARARIKLPKDANRIVWVRGLPYKITADELYDIFGKYGSVRQIRKGVAPNTKGTAFVVYDDVYDAKNAVDHLSGFNVAGRYLVVLYYDPVREARRAEKKMKDDENDLIRRQSGFA
eukprot:Blabericola_migrator_1__6185@NODE_311_length_10068_cov_114_952505_g254_i0_p7_GENE_NODE_311_length_10068_cov_114_952505_g254_i0NODE_311_length_10068_cov_114_952505_g254_i0_p7_ORF_typecomplete_len149_score16_19RRM_1/PF00076_22/1_3e15RRM_5/PF13893_6/4_8e13RRM_8/PF11835_8/7_1e07RRM_8/PF11835_8/1_9e03RRM_7/PF16367_5/3_7e06DUF4523/PF15023_6/0_009RRM_occluded/PF16842_5/0_022Limkainb1/PF11608_8/2_9e03Limkainb1/PF11608_8/1_9Limkainb1/PF11608_8/2_8e02_NODE_311_length_10068_cov_114_952505_g254_i013431789